MGLPWDGRAWFHCGARLRVHGGQGQDFRTAEPCPAGAEAGLTPQALYERCLRCPAGRRGRARSGAPPTPGAAEAGKGEGGGERGTGAV